MYKYIKYVIIIVILLGVFGLINYFFQPSIDNEIRNTLLEKGFIESEYENLYVKQDGDNKQLSFSTSDYTYMLNVLDANGAITSSLSATYDFQDESIFYSYRLNNINSYNAYFKGNYDGENFTCEKDFSNVVISNSEKENMCSLVESNIRLFYLESKTLFTNYKIINYIKQK